MNMRYPQLWLAVVLGSFITRKMHKVGFKVIVGTVSIW